MFLGGKSWLFSSCELPQVTKTLFHQRWAVLDSFAHTSSIPIPEQQLLIHKTNSSLGRHQRLLCISPGQTAAAEGLRVQHRQDSMANTSPTSQGQMGSLLPWDGQDLSPLHLLLCLEKALEHFSGSKRK